MASPASAPTSVAPTVIAMGGLDSIELRQAPAVAPVGQLPAQEPPVPVTTLPAVAPAPQQPAIPAPAIPVPANLNPIPVPAPVPAPVPIPVPAPAPAPAPAPTVVSSVSLILPAATTTLPDAVAPAVLPTTVPIAPFSNVPFVTVVWEETFIGGTLSTWAPYTVSLDFKPSTVHAAFPGKGGIGLGTLTGETGHTQTVVIAAAPTQGAVWIRGVAAAVGVGIAGVMI
ncbi:hypothetical protein PTMSG1_03122 [Pyrenophora teres f. maculata]|nr:hypothetical protein PTMSG1_03122 [Pyrenophora teres f. maculata]